MKVSHVLYKTNNLKTSFTAFEKLGFNVEYGSIKKPHNALIYFSHGPYIEILEKAPISRLIKLILRLIGKGLLVERFNSWGNAKEGFFEICLENDTTNFEKEIKIFNKFKEGFFVTRSKRIDPSHRVLTWKLLFPDQIKIPFLMTKFSKNPKPKNFTHSNKVKRIKQISYGTDSKFISILNELCDDETLQLFEGHGVKDVFYEK